MRNYLCTELAKDTFQNQTTAKENWIFYLPTNGLIHLFPVIMMRDIAIHSLRMPVVSFNALLYSQGLLNGILSRKSRIGIAIRDSVRNIYMPYIPLWIDLSVGGVTVYSQHVPAYNPSSSMLNQVLGHWI